MSLTKQGKKVLAKMKETYKDEDKARQVFYASINSGAPGSHLWHKGTKMGQGIGSIRMPKGIRKKDF